MSVRKDALAWFRSTIGTEPGAIFTSKFYVPEQSWTSKNAWWIQIPVKQLHAGEHEMVHFLCQVAPQANDFYYFQVPRLFLLQHLPVMTVMPNDRISLFLSAEPGNLFEDERGSGRIRFNSFLISKLIQ